MMRSLARTAVSLLVASTPLPALAANCFLDDDRTAIVVGSVRGDMNGDYAVAISTWEGVTAVCSWFNGDGEASAPSTPATIDCNLGTFAVTSTSSDGAISVADLSLLKRVDCGSISDRPEMSNAAIAEILAGEP
jgi:hypothetical protein